MIEATSWKSGAVRPGTQSAASGTWSLAGGMWLLPGRAIRNFTVCTSRVDGPAPLAGSQLVVVPMRANIEIVCSAGLRRHLRARQPPARCFARLSLAGSEKAPVVALAIIVRYIGVTRAR